jgi:hypothetical protein
VHCADYKNRNKEGDATHFLIRKHEISTTEVEKNWQYQRSVSERKQKSCSIQEDWVFTEETKLVEEAPRPKTFCTFWPFLSSH